jgi:hypothetical protein
MRLRVTAVSLLLILSPAWYVRREYRPPAAATVTPDGSRDRTLPGKARIRERRNTTAASTNGVRSHP